LEEYEAITSTTKSNPDKLLSFLRSRLSKEGEASVKHLSEMLKVEEGDEAWFRFMDSIVLLSIAGKYTERKPKEAELVGWAIYITMKGLTPKEALNYIA